MKKIFLVLCLGIIGFSRISLAAGETGEAITKVKQNAEKIESETSVDKAEEAKEEKEAKKKKLSNPFKKKKVEWELVWRDEFDENKLDTSKWSYWENGNPWNSGNYLDENGELVDQYGFKVKQYYLRDNVKLENGYLVITVKKEDNKTVKIDGKDRKILYSSGAVHTKDKFAVHEGKIEMRATMPEGVGTWPAFWTWPEGYLQATSPIPAREEIDIFEIYGENLQKVTGTAHALKADNTYASFIGNDLKIKKNEVSPVIITVELPESISSLNIGASLAINNVFIHYKSSYLQERNIIQFSFININTTKNEIDYTLNILKQMIGDY